MRDHDGELTFKPRLPPLLERLAFRLLFRGRRLMVDVSKRDATYTLLAGRQLKIAHYGKAITVSRKTPATETIPPVVECPAPSQPPGRAPVRRARQS
jgi:alpha,alpha-trehalose phosphorylase